VQNFSETTDLIGIKINRPLDKYHAIENKKKIEMAMINTLQLAARKNVIQMSSDVINYNSNCHSGLSRHLSTTFLDYFVFPYLKNNVFKNRSGTIPELMQLITDNCNLIDVPGPDFAKVI
jgi:hypothetical protein